MRVTMRNWQSAAGSYKYQTPAAAGTGNSGKLPGAPTQTETAADRYHNTKDPAADDFYGSIRGQVQDQSVFLNSMLGDDQEDFLSSLLGEDEKSFLSSLLGENEKSLLSSLLEEDEKSLLSSLLGNQEEESFLDSLLAQVKESSNFKMSVSMPDDSTGQLATELARSETKMNVLQVSSKAIRALGTLKIAYALSSGEDKEKIGRMIRRLKNLSKEEQLELQRKRAEKRQQQEKELEIRKEITKRKRKRRREENHYASKEVMQDRKEALQETLDSIAGLGSSSAAAAAAEGLVSAAAAGAGSGAVSAGTSAAAAGGVTAGTVSMDAAAADAAADVAV